MFTLFTLWFAVDIAVTITTVIITIFATTIDTLAILGERLLCEEGRHGGGRGGRGGGRRGGAV